MKAVVEWLQAHYNADENPGMGAKGLYYYYHTLSKALSIAKIDFIQTKDGKTIDWRADMTSKLLSLQKGDGSWSNAEGPLDGKRPRPHHQLHPHGPRPHSSDAVTESSVVPVERRSAPFNTQADAPPRPLCFFAGGCRSPLIRPPHLLPQPAISYCHTGAPNTPELK